VLLFTKQTLKAGESAEFPVVFFVIRHPGRCRRPGIEEITIVHTFYPADRPSGARSKQVRIESERMADSHAQTFMTITWSIQAGGVCPEAIVLSDGRGCCDMDAWCASYVLAIGFAMVLYTMSCGGVMCSPRPMPVTYASGLAAPRYGMLLFIASEVMFFVGLVLAFFDASRFAGEAKWPRGGNRGIWRPRAPRFFDPFPSAVLNTLILLTSARQSLGRTTRSWQ